MRYQVAQVVRALSARRIASGPLGQAWIVVAAVVLGVKPLVPGSGRVALPVRLPTGRWMLLSDVSELRVLSEIFLDQIYDVAALPPSARVIIDLGANTGAASVFFADRYPAAQIVAYEADPQVAARTRRNLRGLPVEVHAAAVSDSTTPVRLRRSTGNSWATSAYADQGEPFVTAGQTLDAIIGDRAVDILKLDIEGSEYAAVKASTRLDQVALILGEFHPVDGVTADDFFGLLGDFELLFGGGQERATFAARRRSAAASTSPATA